MSFFHQKKKRRRESGPGELRDLGVAVPGAEAGVPVHRVEQGLLF